MIILSNFEAPIHHAKLIGRRLDDSDFKSHWPLTISLILCSIGIGLCLGYLLFSGWWLM